MRGEPGQAVTKVFIWDSQDVVGGGKVIFRAIPIDDEIGVESAGLQFKEVLSSFNVEPLEISDPAMDGPQDVEVADLDGDGTFELVTANEGSNSLTIFDPTHDGDFTLETTLEGLTRKILELGNEPHVHQRVPNEGLDADVVVVKPFGGARGER